jgi:hypothetical protein
MATAKASATVTGSEVGRPQPQTTVVAPTGGDFLRYTQPARGPVYSQVAQWGQVFSQPLVPKPGYARRYRLTISATSSGNTANVAVTPDAPFNVVSQVVLKDPFGTPVISGTGYEILYLVPKYSGAYGLFSSADIKNLPSYVAPVTGTAGNAGSFSFSTVLPLEFAKTYGVLSIATADLQPSLVLNMSPTSSVYSTAPTSTPSLQISLDVDYYMLPQGVDITPPGLGSSRQWILNQFQQVVQPGQAATISAPQLGGYIDTIILIARDSTGQRNDAVFTGSGGGRFQLIVDGVPWVDSTVNELLDDFAVQYPGVTRDAGVLVFTRKNSLAEPQLGLMDTYESAISTTPGTGLQINMSPWPNFTNGPATIYALFGTVVPAGQLIQGHVEI